MGIDKLPPGPWELIVQDWQPQMIRSADGTVCGIFTGDAAGAMAMAQFVVMARKAFDVMMRRHWGVRLGRESWIVLGADDAWLWHEKHGYFKGADPFTALVEADEWYRENVEEKAN